ncbi:DUF3953 domain-containing protein [Alkalihalobacterium bogoriense]
MNEGYGVLLHTLLLIEIQEKRKVTGIFAFVSSEFVFLSV